MKWWTELMTKLRGVRIRPADLERPDLPPPPVARLRSSITVAGPARMEFGLPYPPPEGKTYVHGMRPRGTTGSRTDIGVVHESDGWMDYPPYREIHDRMAREELERVNRLHEEATRRAQEIAAEPARRFEEDDSDYENRVATSRRT